MAVENENPEVIDLLISAGADVNVESDVSAVLTVISDLSLSAT